MEHYNDDFESTAAFMDRLRKDYPHMSENDLADMKECVDQFEFEAGSIEVQTGMVLVTSMVHDRVGAAVRVSTASRFTTGDRWLIVRYADVPLGDMFYDERDIADFVIREQDRGAAVIARMITRLTDHLNDLVPRTVQGTVIEGNEGVRNDNAMTMNLTEQLETVAEDIRRLCSVEVTSDDPEVRSVSVAMVALSTVINGYPNTVAPLEDRKVAVIVSGTRREGFGLSLVDVTLDSREAIKFMREVTDNGGIATLDRVIGAGTKPSEAAAILYRVARGMDTPRIVVAGGLFEDTAMRVAVEDLNSRI